ncbi:MAG: hypothetical protein WC380_01870, partial [Pedobacter sp.]
ALVSNFRGKDGSKVISSSSPLSLEISSDGIKYGTNTSAKLNITSASKPKTVLLNGKPVSNFTYDNAKKQVSLQIAEGEGLIKIN